MANSFQSAVYLAQGEEINVLRKCKFNPFCLICAEEND